MRPARSTLEQTGPSPGYTIGISAGQAYRTSSPVTARPMIIRWISDVPSKIVKIFAERHEVNARSKAGTSQVHAGEVGS
jgi:hypothetical protein